MTSILISSPEPKTLSELEGLVKNAQYQQRILASLSATRDWSDRQSFDFVLIDQRFDESEILETIKHIWSKHPLALIGIFCPKYSHVITEAQILGVKFYYGENYLEQIEFELSQLTNLLDKSFSTSIMFVEDLEAPRFILSTLMQSFQMGTVHSFTNSHEALTELEENAKKYFCVITDYNMPEENGLQFLKKIRTRPQIANIPVIIVTAYGTQENLIACLKAGVTGFLVKPPNKESLKEEISKAKRISQSGLSARLCHPDDATQLEKIMLRYAEKLSN